MRYMNAQILNPAAFNKFLCGKYKAMEMIHETASAWDLPVNVFIDFPLQFDAKPLQQFGCS